MKTNPVPENSPQQGVNGGWYIVPPEVRQSEVCMSHVSQSSPAGSSSWDIKHVTRLVAHASQPCLTSPLVFPGIIFLFSYLYLSPSQGLFLREPKRRRGHG